MYNAAADQRVTTADRSISSTCARKSRVATAAHPLDARLMQPNITAKKHRHSAHGWLWTNALYPAHLEFPRTLL